MYRQGADKLDVLASNGYWFFLEIKGIVA